MRRFRPAGVAAASRAVRSRSLPSRLLPLVLLALLASLAACAMPAPQYEDPLAGFNAAPAAFQRFDDVRLGVVFSDNVQKSLDYIKKYHDALDMGIFSNTGGMEDLDVAYVPDNLKDILSRSFKEVTKVDSVAQAKSMDLDAAMVFDMQTALGTMSGEQNTVNLKGVFLDPEGTVLAEIEGRGLSVVPYPAMIIGFKEAAGKALKAMGNDMGSSKTLKAALEGLTAPTMMVTEAAPAASGAEAAPMEPLPVPSGVEFGRYFAVVIGVDNYAALPRLHTARNDATAVAETLRDEYGYHVRLLLDAGRAQILEALGEMRRTLTQRDNLLVYYAGHGWLDRDADQGYWLPVDATPDSEVNWVSNDTVTGALKAIQAKHVLVVADSCYSGKLTRGLHIARRTPGYFQRMAALRTRLVMSSGGLEPVADEGGGGHSVFAEAFLKALESNTGIMDGTGLFSRIRRPVMLDSDQTPEYADIRKAGHEGGDFLFVRR